MKALKCEMCDSTDIVKQDGFYVCQYCGTKYTVEEAKKLMIEGTVDVSGSTVKIDDSLQKQDQINNYLEMAKSAFDGNDVEGVIRYCDKVLEIDMNSYEAWVLKAKVAGWGSTLSDIKVPQAITASKRAVNLAPESKKYDIAGEVYDSIKCQILSLLLIAQEMPGVSGCQYIHMIMSHWQSALQEIPYLSKDIIEAEIDYCRTLCENSSKAFFQSARLIFASYYALNNNESYDITFRKALQEKIDFEGEREQGFKEKAKAEADAKRMEYWKANPDEKSNLEAKKKTAESRIETLNEEINNIPEMIQSNDIHSKIDDLAVQKNALGLFKGKEKKDIQSQIDELKEKLKPLETIISQRKNEIQAQIDEQTKIIEKVEAEFSKER